jgi:hypothetical protein
MQVIYRNLPTLAKSEVEGAVAKLLYAKVSVCFNVNLIARLISVRQKFV